MLHNVLDTPHVEHYAEQFNTIKQYFLAIVQIELNTLSNTEYAILNTEHCNEDYMYKTQPDYRMRNCYLTGSLG